jgi:predicted DCC family thiol-disulfide oxidoreductase YuxK
LSRCHHTACIHPPLARGESSGQLISDDDSIPAVDGDGRERLHPQFWSFAIDTRSRAMRYDQTVSGAMTRGMKVADHAYRSDPSVPPFVDDRPSIIFDGHCVLCSRFAQFVIKKGRRRHFRLLAAQSDLGKALYTHLGLDPVNYGTNILLQDGRAWFKSDGSIKIFKHLGFPWHFASIARLLPRFVRDGLYDVIAKNRLRWFGTRQVCFRPDPADADRFLA